MQIAFNIGCLYRPDGISIMRSGIAYSMDSLLTALYQTSSPHTIHAFAPVGSQATIEKMAADGEFSWWTKPEDSSRVDVAGNSGPLPNIDGRGMTIPFRLRRKRSFLAARKAIQKYDLMHSPAPAYLAEARYAPRFNVATLYDMTVRTHPWGHAPANVMHWERFFAFAQHRCQIICTISEASKAEIVELLKVPEDRVVVTLLAPREHTHLLSPGPERDALLKEVGVDPKVPFLLYSGTIEPRKNTERLIRGFARVLYAEPSLRDCKIVLSGGVWMGLDEKMREVAAEEGIADNLIQTGYVSNAQMNALMSACRAFAYISLSEGFGMPPLEAMVCGAPVVTSNLSAMPEVVGDAGILVDPKNLSSIAQGLHKILIDDTENANRRNLSIERAKLFTWERAAKQTLKAYEMATAG